MSRGASTWTLGTRLLARDWRAGELKVLLVALVIAVLVSTAISFFTNRLERGMTSRAAEFLGADLVVSSRTELPDEYLQHARNSGMLYSEVVEFSSVIASQSDMQLSSVKAVSESYPLRGEVRIADSPFAEERVAITTPPRGSVWAEGRLLNVLDVAPTDTVEIGLSQLQVGAVLTHEPDRAGDFYSLTPRVLMNLADLPETGIIQPGSRVRYRLLLAGTEEQQQRFVDWIRPRLESNQRLTSVADDNRQIGSALGRASQFLGLASIAAVVLAGVAVALSANRFASRHFDTSALLRCLGASRQHVLSLFLVQLGCLGLLATLLGLVLGWGMQAGLVWLLGDLLPPDMPPPGIKPLLVGAGTGLIALAGFALPPLMRLGRVAPLRVLRRDLAPLPSSGWLIYGLALAALALLMWQFTGNLELTLAVVLGGAVAVLILGALAWALLRLAGQRLRNAGLAWRLGTGQLLKQPVTAAGQILSFGLIIMSMVVIVLLRTELLDSWQTQLPDDTPNHFALNILPSEAPAFRAKLDEIGAVAAPLYPVTPGRLVEVNGQPVRALVTKDSQADRAINRDLSLTSAAELAADNEVIDGMWWDDTIPASAPLVSVEAELAAGLDIQTGDTLAFVIAGNRLQAQVASIRKVQWDNFTPNFYMIFSPGSLDHAPTTILTAFSLPSDNRDALRNLSRAFPAMTLLEVEAILDQIRDILAQVTLAVEYVLLFVLLAGFTVLFAGLQATLDDRLYEGALLRTLGAGRGLLRRANHMEFALLGALAGILAIASAELITWTLYRQVMDLQWQPHWLAWLLVPLGSALLISITGALGTRAVVNQSPMRLINQGGGA